MQFELVYIKCPHCGKWFKNTNLISYSVFGSQECWSDGKCISNNLSEYSFLPFSKCNGCGKFFWFDDCQSIENYLISEYIDNPTKEIEKIELIKDFIAQNHEFAPQKDNNLSLNYPPPEYWHNLPLFFTNDFKFLLENKINLNFDKEIYLRTQLMQHINDFVRLRLFKFKNFELRNFVNHLSLYLKNKRHYFKFRNLRKENLQKLSEILEQYSDYSDINFQLIEIERELGNFGKCKILIDNITPEERKQNEKFITKSLNRIKFKSKRVFEI